MVTVHYYVTRCSAFGGHTSIKNEGGSTGGVVSNSAGSNSGIVTAILPTVAL